jgi:serine/threonine protein kinase
VAVTGDIKSAEVAGKVAYMSPEQLKGKPTIQSDIYSLGCTLYYMLTGLHPEPLDECWPILANDKVPKELNDLVIQCTKLDVKERYQNVEAVQSALQAI